MSNPSLKELKLIAKMQNVSQNDLDQITKMVNLSRNELELIAKMRRIKNYKNMSKEGLLIALLKSEHSFAELQKSNSDNAEIEKTRKNFDELRDKSSRSKIKKIRKTLCRIESNKNISRLEAEEIEQYFSELKKSLQKFKKYYDYKGITKE